MVGSRVVLQLKLGVLTLQSHDIGVPPSPDSVQPRRSPFVRPVLQPLRRMRLSHLKAAIRKAFSSHSIGNDTIVV